MVKNQHTEATRKKLREAGFFLRLLAGVPKYSAMTPEPEAGQFYLSAFLSAARAVSFALQMERKAEWDAWIKGWRASLSDRDLQLWKYLVDQRNKVHKEGGPELTVTVTPMSLMEFMQGDVIIGTRMPGTPRVPLTTLVTSLTAHPGQTLAESCQPLFELVSRMVDEFERAHPPT